MIGSDAGVEYMQIGNVQECLAQQSRRLQEICRRLLGKLPRALNAARKNIVSIIGPYLRSQRWFLLHERSFFSVKPFDPDVTIHNNQTFTHQAPIAVSSSSM